MAAWVLRTARHVLDLAAEDRRSELTEELKLSDEELERWEDISRRLFVPFHADGIISQFEGYEHLEEFDWEGYRRKYDDIQRLDRILESEGDTPNRYKASKQADVLMLFYLFSAEELGELFQQLDYPFDSEMIPRNIEYYVERTSHGSTLSRVVHSWVLARSDREQSWELFQRALESDVTDIQGGTTAEGIHLGAMAGTVDLIQRGHTGIEMRGEVLWLNPCLPEELDSVRLRVRYRGHWLRLKITQKRLKASFEKGWSESAKIGFRGQVHVMEQGETKEFALR
jgi:alpha,alpha-trehalase